MDFELELFGSDFSDSSDDEDMINFIVHLGRPRRERVFRNRADHFHQWDDFEFRNRFRLSKRLTNILLNLIAEKIRSPSNWNNAVTPMQMLLLTLRFLASGGMIISMGDFIGIHRSTAGKYIWKVLCELAFLRNRYIIFPSDNDSLTRMQHEFYSIASFPKVVGCIDCTHIKIQSPGGADGEVYRNRKQFFSKNVQMVCNARLEIIDVVARWPGSAHDSRIFLNSRVRARFEAGEFGDAVLLGDSGYGLSPFLLTPIHQPQTRAENLFNEAQIRTRNTIERTFGILKRRFPLLATGIRLSLWKVQCIVVVTVILHNMAITDNDIEPPAVTLEMERAIQFMNNMPVDPLPRQRNHEEYIIREKYLSFFANIE